MELRRSSHYDGFEINSERDIKSISDWLLVHHSLIMMRILEKFWKLAIKYKLGLRLFLLFTSKTQNNWCVAHSVICIGLFQKISKQEG